VVSKHLLLSPRTLRVFIQFDERIIIFRWVGEKLPTIDDGLMIPETKFTKIFSPWVAHGIFEG